MAPTTSTPPESSTTDDLDTAFTAHRRELTAYCYRMLGSGAEAEDAVQETLVRAWKAFDRFEGRSSIRSWLYRIASNVCIDMLRSPQRRARPMDLGPATPVQGATPGDARGEHSWVQPIRDDRVIDLDGDPAEVAATRESIRLAFVAALQHLPPRQRACLILCEVLKWSAQETAELLDTSLASVNSALQRARATMATVHVDDALTPLGDPAQEALLTRYVDAFERYDIAALTAVLRDDAVLTMPPFPTWLQGVDDVIAWMFGQGSACAGSRLIRIDLNGTAGYASYKPAGPDSAAPDSGAPDIGAPDGRLDPWAIQVIEVRGGAVSAHHNFIGPELFAEFGLPDHLTP